MAGIANCECARTHTRIGEVLKATFESLQSVLSLYILGVVMVKRRFGSAEVGDKGVYVGLDATRNRPNDEPARSSKKL